MVTIAEKSNGSTFGERCDELGISYRINQDKKQRQIVLTKNNDFCSIVPINDSYIELAYIKGCDMTDDFPTFKFDSVTQAIEKAVSLLR